MNIRGDLPVWQEFEGRFVPRHHDPGYVVLSFLVSFIGSWTTFELIHKRTYYKGWYNWALLLLCALIMGGMSVWCERYIGDRAIILGAGELELQPLYDPGLIALSFFLAVAFTIISIAVVGSKTSFNYIRYILGGTIAGLGFCGSFYAGQAGIRNYDCFHDLPFVIAAVAIAVLTHTTAWALHGWTVSSWKSSWWMRGCCAFIMAGAISAMYWLNSIGTLYRLKEGMSLDRSGQSTRNATIITVVVLSVIGCFALIVIFVVKGTDRLAAGHVAQQVVLATAIFDKEGQLMVTPRGILPWKKITDSYLEQNINDTFDTTHPNFQWILRVTHNWKSIKYLVPSMKHHLHDTGLKKRFGADANYMNERGTPIKNYHLIFRELFCTAADELASDLHCPIEQLGIMWDTIVSTDQKPKQNRFMAEKRNSSVDLEKEGLQLEAIGRGQLLFLVRQVDERGAEHLRASGYRFAEPIHLVPILSALFRIRRVDLMNYIEGMYRYSHERQMLDAGIHFGLFCARAAVGAGFDVLARRDATNLLPTMEIPIETLEEWQLEYLKTLDTETVSTCLKAFNRAARNKASPPIEKIFAATLRSSLEALKAEINDSFFNDARLIAQPVEVPCRGTTKRSRPSNALMIAFRIFMPLQARPPGYKCDYVPLVLFKTQQQVYPNAPDHSMFSHKAYRDFAAMLDLESRDSTPVEDVVTPPASLPASPLDSSYPKKRQRRWFARRSSDETVNEIVDRHEHRRGHVHRLGHNLGGILVTRGISVEVDERDMRGAHQPQGMLIDSNLNNRILRETEGPPYVDELFKLSVRLR